MKNRRGGGRPAACSCGLLEQLPPVRKRHSRRRRQATASPIPRRERAAASSGWPGRIGGRPISVTVDCSAGSIAGPPPRSIRASSLARPCPLFRKAPSAGHYSGLSRWLGSSIMVHGYCSDPSLYVEISSSPNRTDAPWTRCRSCATPRSRRRCLSDVDLKFGVVEVDHGITSTEARECAPSWPPSCFDSSASRFQVRDRAGSRESDRTFPRQEWKASRTLYCTL